MLDSYGTGSSTQILVVRVIIRMSIYRGQIGDESCPSVAIVTG
jgi:hypothetical protein